MSEEELEIEDVDDESFYLRELRKLEKKLKIATKALKWYADYTNSMKGVFNMKPEKEAQEALKEMEGVE